MKTLQHAADAATLGLRCGQPRRTDSTAPGQRRVHHAGGEPELAQLEGRHQRRGGVRGVLPARAVAVQARAPGLLRRRRLLARLRHRARPSARRPFPQPSASVRAASGRPEGGAQPGGSGEARSRRGAASRRPCSELGSEPAPPQAA